jgi:MoaA/NifB/PqqE/SkfB family radical SAM enzyme
MLAKGKLSLRKVFNAIFCFIAYFLKLNRSARYPFMINFELGNECNANCLFCRTEKGDIYDHNPEGAGAPIPKGKLPFEVFASVIDECKNHLMMAVLYANGEPFLYKDIFNAIRYASGRGVATMTATNGQLLSERNSRELLEAGLDFVKIAISGFTQEVYAIQQKRGNIELVKNNIRNLARLKKEGGYGIVIMLDFISYTYNAHQVESVKRFCGELGIIFNVRPGNLRGLEDREPAPARKPELPVKTLCAWPWEVMTINWDGALLPCCDYAVWSGSVPYARYQPGKNTIRDVWNGKSAANYRDVHIKKGRAAIPVCAQCDRDGTAFKY